MPKIGGKVVAKKWIRNLFANIIDVRVSEGQLTKYERDQIVGFAQDFDIEIGYVEDFFDRYNARIDKVVMRMWDVIEKLGDNEAGKIVKSMK